MATRAQDFTRTVRAARETFLATGRTDLPVRREIEASWRRSSVSGVQPELRQLPDVRDLVERNGRLYVAAKPVLEDLAARLGDTSTSILLADRQARVITRWVGDIGLRRRLDQANSVDGASLHEDVVGTNGLGSVLAEGRAVQVAGPEHYIDAFQGFTCVGAPVRHPLNGQIEGIVTLAVRYEHSNELLFPMVLQVTEEIRQRMLLQATARERMLLDTFLSVARRSTRPVVSVSDQIIITNPAAARLLDGVDHAVLWEFASQATAGNATASTELPLSDGEMVSARLRTVDDGRSVFGAVIEIDASHARPRRRETAPVGLLPGLAGGSRAWRRSSEAAAHFAATSLPMIVSGERGVGKLALVEAVFAARSKGDDLTIVDAAMEPADGATTWLAGVQAQLRERGVLVIRHIESLSDAAAHGLAGILDAHTQPTASRVVGTLTSDGDEPPPPLRALMERLGVARVEVPPLRQRREDLPHLVSALWRCHAPGRPLPRWGPDAMHALAQHDWPGNIRELESLVRRLVVGNLGTEVRLEDLPEEYRRQPLRSGLSRLEQLEAGAIRNALEAHAGNKHRAARELGISRSTLYRKLEALAPGLL
jgi:transcriptional regulator of acetoin/glycerol metabolism